MSTFLIITHCIIVIFLVIVVLLQSGKGGGLGGLGGGGSQTLFGSSGSSNFFTKLTTVLAVLFMITSVSLTINRNKTAGSSLFDKNPMAAEAPMEGMKSETKQEEKKEDK